MFQNVLAYEICYEQEQKKCMSTPLSRHKKVNLEECKDLCDHYENCKFIFWNTVSACSLHETCDDFETTYGVETLLAKDSCPGKYCFFYEYDHHYF